ncbi:hypothetical protein BKA83DRAFT_4122217 [Pisolithus microcarpus]|nr:hypothetical protein BKA83DRAFT_4122217 [Pisolithus microcarpus]
MSNFRLTSRMINKEALCLLSQYVSRMITLEVALDEIKYILKSDFDEDEWMELTQNILLDRLDFADVEKEFVEMLAERELRNATVSPTSDPPKLAGPSLKGQPNLATSDLTAEGHNSEVGPLLKDPSAWRLMMDWAQDKMDYPEFDDKIREFGPRYVHAEWQPLINTIFALSDPSNEDPRQPSSLVEDAMQIQGVRFAAPADHLPTASAIQPSPPQSAMRCPAGQAPRKRPSGQAPKKRKRRRTSVMNLLDLAADEDDDESEENENEDEDVSQTEGSSGGPMAAGPSRRETFSRAIDSMVARYSASAQSFVHQYMQSRGVDVTSLPWLPRRLYVAGTCPAEIQNYLPPSHRFVTKEITLLPPIEATSLTDFKTQQTLPVRTWVRINKGIYKGDVGFVERSDRTHVVLVVAPRERPYDMPEQSGEKSLFSSELAALAGLRMEPIVSPAGVEIGFTCGDHDFIHGLLRLTAPTSSVTLVELPQPDDIAFHMITGFERSFVEKTMHLFSAQFWREFDAVEIRGGQLRGSTGTLIDVEWHKRTATVLLHSAEGREGDLGGKENTIHSSIQDLRRVFSTGQTVRIIAGPYRGYVGHIVAACSGTVSLQYDGQATNVEVSELLLETHVPDHVRSLSTRHTGVRMHLPEPTDGSQPGDTAVVCKGPYKGAEAPIEWMNTDGNQMWIYVKKGTDSFSAESDTGSTPTQHVDLHVDCIMVPVNFQDIRVYRAARTISFSTEKGFDVCVGDDIEVARGKWFRSRGTVQAVHVGEAYLDFVCDTYGQKISVPITFCRKVAERSDVQLSRWIGRDVWVIRGDKKGYQGTLRSIGRDSSHVALQGQPVQLRNNQIATPTGLVLDGTILPLDTVQELQRRSFVPVVRSITPPPPPSMAPPSEGSSATTSDAWMVTAEDLSPATHGYGDIPWLFQPNFCNFHRLHLGFTVNDQYRPYNNASLGKRIVRTRSPDPFRNDSGAVPHGHVGSAIQTHVVPASCLKPANPAAKNQLLLILIPVPFAGDKGILCLSSWVKNSRWLNTELRAAERRRAGAAGMTGKWVAAAVPASGRFIDVGCKGKLVVGEELTMTTDEEDREDEAEKYNPSSAETDSSSLSLPTGVNFREEGRDGNYSPAAVLKLDAESKVSSVVVVVELRVSDAVVRTRVSGGGPVESKSVVVDLGMVIVVSDEWDGVEMT